MSRSLRPNGLKLLLLACAGWLQLSCYSQMYCKDPGQTPPGMNQCVGGGGAPEAIITTVAAGALWAGAGGCKIAGCPHPLTCNSFTERCERPFCGEGYAECPVGTSCDSQTHRCF